MADEKSPSRISHRLFATSRPEMGISMENEMIYSGTEHMDIKSGGREMATVVYSNKEEGMCSFVIDGEEYVEDEERAIIPDVV